MPTANGFNTGKDITLVISTPTGVLQIDGLTGFKAAQLTQPLDSKLITGDNIYDEIPLGWSGTFNLERLDSAVDDYFAADENGYFTGVKPNSIVTITQVIQENVGTTIYRFAGVALKFEDAGEWRGDQKVMQSISFKASRRLKVQ
jgi:hypothetical protein